MAVGENDLQRVLIVAYARSGSTLLQGILNTIDGWLIRGENHNFAYGLFRAYRGLEMAKALHGGDRSTRPVSSWFGASEIDLDGFKDGARQLIEQVLLGERDRSTLTCYGFKEVRYLPGVPPKGSTLPYFGPDPTGKALVAYLDFLNDCLAPCKMVFLKRDHAAVRQSGMWRDVPEQPLMRQLAFFDRLALDYCEARKDRCYRIAYEDIVARNGRLAGLFDFLGAAPEPARLRAALDTPHSYDLRSFQPR